MKSDSARNIEDGELVGVEIPWDLSGAFLKRQALMFDRIGALFLGPFLRDQGQGWKQSWSIAELNWLIDQGFLFDPGVPWLENMEELHQLPEFVREYESYRGVLGRKGGYRDELEEIRDSGRCLEFLPRLAAIPLNRDNSFKAVSISRFDEGIPQPYSAGDQNVFEIVLNQLPEPDETVSWEQIMEFRSDPESKGKFWGVRTWMSEIAKAQLSPAEIIEKIEWSLYEYQKHMKLHRMKINYGTLRTLVTVGTGVAEGLVKFKWSKAAELLFSVHDRKLALLEAESGAPGRELAYIVAARERFKE